MVWTKMLWKTALASVLAEAFAIRRCTVAHADDYYGCRRNVEKWEARLDHDVNHHGAYSRQANHDRHELAEARENCDRHYGNHWR